MKSSAYSNINLSFSSSPSSSRFHDNLKLIAWQTNFMLIHLLFDLPRLWLFAQRPFAYTPLNCRLIAYSYTYIGGSQTVVCLPTRFAVAVRRRAWEQFEQRSRGKPDKLLLTLTPALSHSFSDSLCQSVLTFLFLSFAFYTTQRDSHLRPTVLAQPTTTNPQAHTHTHTHTHAHTQLPLDVPRGKTSMKYFFFPLFPVSLPFYFCLLIYRCPHLFCLLICYLFFFFFLLCYHFCPLQNA